MFGWSPTCCWSVLASLLVAHSICAAHPPCGPATCGVRYVEKTVMVPNWVVEKRKVTCTEYKKENREHTYVVHRCVPETKQVTQEYTVLVPETRQREEKCTVMVPVTKEVEQTYHVKIPEWKEVEHTYEVCVPVYTDVEQTFTVLVPHEEKRVGTRRVCRMVPVTEKRTIRKDVGHWEKQVVEVPCAPVRCGYGGCAPACSTTTVCRSVWVPKIVEEEIDVTVCKPQYEDQQYEYSVLTCKPETRTRTVRQCSYKTETRTGTSKVCSYRTEQRSRTVKVCDYQPEVRTRTVEYTVCVPQKRTKTCDVTTYKTVAEERTGTHTVLVPVQVEKEVDVRVCRMVPKKVKVAVGCGCAVCGY